MKIELAQSLHVLDGLNFGKDLSRNFREFGPKDGQDSRLKLVTASLLQEFLD
jgi:hypothetical protein